MDRHFSKAYLIVNEVFNAVTHGIGFGLSVAGLVLLLIKGARLHSPLHIVSYSIYGSCLLLLFLFSTLFHSLVFTKAKKVFQVFDHCSIFLLIGGTYTPFCLLAMPLKIGIPLLAIIWLLGIGGMVYKAITLHRCQNVSKWSTLLYLVMGWLVLFTLPLLKKSIGMPAVTLLFLGGVSYSIGAFTYHLRQLKFMHVVWHLFVLLAAILMFFSVYCYT